MIGDRKGLPPIEFVLNWSYEKPTKFVMSAFNHE